MPSNQNRHGVGKAVPGMKSSGKSAAKKASGAKSVAGTTGSAKKASSAKRSATSKTSATKKTGSTAKRSSSGSSAKKAAGRALTQGASSSSASVKATGVRLASPPSGRQRSVSAAARKPPAPLKPRIRASKHLPSSVHLRVGQLDELDNLERMIRNASEVTVTQGPSAVHLGGTTVEMLRQVVALVRAGAPRVLLFGDQTDTELTSQEVADLLNVSRPHVVKLAKAGDLPHRMVGNRHRFRLSDVEEYEAVRRTEREEVLAAMVPEAGYTAEDF